MAHSVGHEAGFDPFSALFEVFGSVLNTFLRQHQVFEELELVHRAPVCACGGAPRFAAKRKGAAWGRASDFFEALLYTFSIAF